ncbi:MAG: hypothetical protein QF415_16250 [Candidatus Undinarchaeales archaeon]|nr:hypothetical protein [Candidatus Undinarchaeales archaeon]MDP7494368.1 hypothetical protein [Candidatus Undinarchaeales archaeon]
MTLEDHAQRILTPLAIIALVIALISFFGMVAAGNVPPKVKELPALANAVGTLNATLTAPIGETNMLAVLVIAGLLIMILSCYMMSQRFYRMVEEGVAAMDIEYDGNVVDDEEASEE